MKKLFAFILVLAMIFSLTACGKSKAASAADELIAAIGDVTLESEEAITAAEEAVEALDSKDKDSLENMEILTAARSDYDELYIEKVEEIYSILKDAYDLTDDMGTGLYSIMSAAVTSEDEIKEDGIAFMEGHSNLPGDDIRMGIIAETAAVAKGDADELETVEEIIDGWIEDEGSKEAMMNVMLSDEDSDGDGEADGLDDDSINAVFSIVNPLMNFCAYSARAAYYLNGRYTEIHEKLDEANELIKEFKDNYPEFENMDDLENIYVTTTSYLTWCEDLSGSILSSTSTLDEYRTSVNESIAALDLVL